MTQHKAQPNEASLPRVGREEVPPDSQASTDLAASRPSEMAHTPGMPPPDNDDTSDTEEGTVPLTDQRQQEGSLLLRLMESSGEVHLAGEPPHNPSVRSPLPRSTTASLPPRRWRGEHPVRSARGCDFARSGTLTA